MLYRRHPVITALLLPFSVIYGIGVSIRNFLFDSGVFSSRIFDIPVISVGNITVGGTGKTPHVEYILSLLKNDFKVAVLSRGYKRKTSGFIVASDNSGVDEIGDEPLQIKKDFLMPK
jgi:tetraacyldisaccharide 4'-kinase